MATKKKAAKKKSAKKNVRKRGSKAKGGAGKKRMKGVKGKAATGTPITVGGDG